MTHRLCILALAAVFVLVVPLCALAGMRSGPQTSLLQGSVQDWNGNVYVCPDCTVTVTSVGFEKTVKLNPVGRFVFELSPGVYRIATNVPGTYPVQRGEIRLRPAEVITLTLRPSLTTSSISSEVTPDGFSDTAKRLERPGFQEMSGPSPKPGIEFDSKQVVEGKTVYRHALFSYHDWTMYADRLSCRRLTMDCVASGKRVFVEYGGSHQEVVDGRLSVNDNAVSFEWRAEGHRTGKAILGRVRDR